MERFGLGGGNVLAWSAIGLGAGEFVVGLYQVVTGTAQSPRQEQAGMRALFNSLVALAVVDGPIKDHEVKTIRQTIKDATGVALDEWAIRRLARRHLEGRIELKGELEKASKHMTEQGLNAVIAGAHQLLTGRAIDQRERECLTLIGTSLAFDDELMAKLVPQPATIAV
jgi:hypothetical protein